MNIDDADPRRMEIALEQFRARFPVVYKGILLSVSKNGVLEVNSYSSYSDPSRISMEMAKSGIENSKQVVSELFTQHPEFSRVVTNFVREYYFCCDYQTGAFAVAQEKLGEFKWLLKNNG